MLESGWWAQQTREPALDEPTREPALHEPETVDARVAGRGSYSIDLRFHFGRYKVPIFSVDILAVSWRLHQSGEPKARGYLISGFVHDKPVPINIFIWYMGCTLYFRSLRLS